MHGVEVDDDSPYVEMTRRVIANYPNVSLEPDWSAAAFWYEYVAIHGGELLLEGLTADSIQGDRVVADTYEKYFGVDTTFLPEGVRVTRGQLRSNIEVILDFTRTPDLSR